MMANQLIFITHPEVMIDPNHPVADWSLSDRGRERAYAFAASGVLAQVSHVWTSSERKARETASILANPRRLPVLIEPALGENDRRATGYLPPPEFEAAATAFFAHPDQSYCGWERAVDAQARILSAVRQIVASHVGRDLALVSHGAVGTLLHCALTGHPIDRRHDQPFQGHWWSADLADLVPKTGWLSIG